MLRLALFGLGAAAERIHLPACAAVPGIELVAASDPDPARRQHVGRRWGLRALHADPVALLDAERPDVVIVATPPASHRDLCLLALDHGAHVLCEKPFARSVSEADEVIAAADQRGRLVLVNNQYRFMRIYRVPQARVAGGEYGAPFLLQCWQQMFHPPSHERNWRAGLVESTLYEFGTHALDLMCFFFGTLPLSITAHIPHPLREIEADVVVHAALRFPGERLAVMTLNRLSHALERYFEMRLDCERASLRISLGGLARASLDWSRARRRPIVRLSLVRGGEARVEAGGRSRVLVREATDAFPAATAATLRSLVEAVGRGAVANDQARHARELLRIVFAAYDSARRGETVWLAHSPA
jgi:D-apiose dehydrogenase